MITQATFQNFKTLRDVTIDFGAFTILVGPNGCGKTSVLQALEMLCQLREGRVMRPAVIFEGAGGVHRLCTNGTDDPLAIRAVSGGIKVELVASKPEADGGSEWKFAVTFDEKPAVKVKRFFLDHPERRALPSKVRLSLDATSIARPSESSSETPVLKPNGEGVASVLSFLAGAYREQLDAIEAELASIVPGIRRIRTYPVVTTTYQQFVHTMDGQEVTVPRKVQVPGHRFAIDIDGRGLVDADMLSEGTLLALGLLTALHHPNAPSLFLIDDIDGALHLGAQVRLLRTIRAIQKQRPELQIIASTHSPFMLQEVAASDVRVMSVGTDGAAHCKPLNQHPEYAKWRTVMNTGEIWANFGEDWVGDDR